MGETNEKVAKKDEAEWGGGEPMATEQGEESARHKA